MENTQLSRILVIEDDESIGMIVRDAVVDAGYCCEVVSDGLRGLDSALTGAFDLLILDLSLPGLSGLDVCREVKRKTKNLPILMLTAKNGEADIVSGLELGADDYLTKPFRRGELIARVRARLRERTERILADRERKELPSPLPTFESVDSETFIIGELVINLKRKEVTKRGELLELSAMEIDFIIFMASHAGRAVDRDEILREIWGMSIDHYDSNVTIFVCRLRRKVEDNVQQPKYIITIPGRGYRFAEAKDFDLAATR